MMDELTMLAAANIAEVSERTIRRAVKAGSLPADLRNPKRARIKRADLERWKSGVPSESVESVTHVADPTLVARMAELERRVSHLERQSDKQRRKVKPVALLEFAALHNVGSRDYQRAINADALPVQRDGDVLLLNGMEQRAFWQVFHELASFLPCGDCPH